MASTYLTKTFSSAGTRTTWTFSAWVKRANTSSTGHQIFDCSPTPGTDESKIYFYNDFIYWKQEISNTADGYLVTNRKFRDTSAWYHIVCKWDTTQSTEADRMKMYINGVEETSFSTNNLPDQNRESYINSANAHYIGSAQTSGSYFDGCMSHIHFCDGYAYDASAFGETDSTTGQWKIKTNPSVSYGTNGFFLFKDNNSADDQSGNDNDFTTSGTLTQTEDCPSNVFCTLNPLGLNADVTFANGNNNATYGTSGTRSIVTGTLGASSGKYYWECEIQGSVSANNAVLGVSMSGWETGYAVAGESNQSWGFRGYDGAVYNNNSSVGGTFATFTNGDIIGVAINLDDEQSGLNKLYFSKNGTWLNGADPSNPSSTTGVIGITKPENGDSGFYFPVISDAGSSATPKFKMNFGNGYFGSTAISSEGTNASGIGKFEYDVPTGFTALSTKGLNE